MSAEQWIGYLAQARLTISKMSSDEGGKKSQKVPTQWKWRDDVSQGSHCEGEHDKADHYATMPQIPPLFAVEFFWHSRVVRAMASSAGSGSLSFSISFSSAWSQWWQELLAQGQWERLPALLASSLSGV
ncbi:hypothetical protein SKAU_G00409170 [Synaphobranchus kaupii]|uniref:Uncharacterized protein n=1 Tax=Synaphobranchus kaupii TaxID=118154 RepID=A0A9Q1IB54_SYNKA|nr:hypothetical protein SKAU_G00409170 [Synaphobranchus kaupii]